MRRECFIKRIVLAVAVASVAMSAFARKDQEWTNFAVNYEIYKGLALHFDQEIEFDNKILVNEESFMSLGYRFCPYFGLAVGHRVVRERLLNRDLQTEHRPTIEVNLHAPEFWTLMFGFRSRFEYRDKSHYEPHVRYRERFRLGTSWSVTDLNISPYVSEELFFSDIPGVRNSDLLRTTRSQAGLTFNLIPGNENLRCTLYFMVNHFIGDGAREWKPLNIYGFEVAYSF